MFLHGGTKKRHPHGEGVSFLLFAVLFLDNLTVEF